MSTLITQATNSIPAMQCIFGYYQGLCAYNFQNPPIYFSLGDAVAGVGLLFTVYQLKNRSWDIVLRIRPWWQKYMFIFLAALGALSLAIGTLLTEIPIQYVQVPFNHQLLFEFISFIFFLAAPLALFTFASKRRKLFTPRRAQVFYQVLLTEMARGKTDDIEIIVDIISANLEPILTALKKHHQFTIFRGSPEEETVASYSRGKSGKRFGSYHCTRGHKRYAIAQTTLEKTYSDYLQHIRFSDSFLQKFEKTLVLKYRKEEGSVATKAAAIGRSVSELKDQKQIKLRAIEAATSSLVKADLEKEYEELHQQILKMQETRNKLEIGEDEIHSFVRYAKALVEHPAKILEKPENIREQVGLYSLFFERFPTYEELINGTPKLSLIFRLSQENTDEKSNLVTLQRIEL